MAVSARTTTTLSHTALTTLAANPGIAANVPDGDTFPNGGNAFVIISNTSTDTAYDVTEAVTVSPDGLTVTGRTWEIPAQSMRIVKLGPPTVYGAVTKLVAENVAIKFAAYAL